MKTKPFSQKDCPGDLREVKDLNEVRALAREAGKRFKAAFGKSSGKKDV